MVDTHVHLLPGIDDGPASMEESIALARALAADGVETAVATPHVREDYPGVVPDQLAERCERLRDALRHADVGLEVVTGGEVDILWATEASDDDLRLVSYGQTGAFLLVETPYSPVPRHFEELLFELQLRGAGIVLAHPERNPTFQADLPRLEALVERGILLQVTASSLLKRDSLSAQIARKLVTQRLAHLIASDSHSENRFGRARLSEGERAATTLAPERASWMVREAPAALLAGHRPEPPARPPRAALRRRLRFWG